MEIIKVDTTKQSLFEQHDRATVMGFLTHFNFELVSSHVIQVYLYSQLYSFFLSYLDSNVFSALHNEHLEADENDSQRSLLINYFVKGSIDQRDSRQRIQEALANPFSLFYSLFFRRKLFGSFWFLFITEPCTLNTFVILLL